MYTILAEQPLLLSLMVGVISGGLLFGWLQTGERRLAIGGLLCFLLVPVIWALASHWETDREQIISIIHRTAAAVQANDHDTAVAVIGDPDTQSQARLELPRYDFTRVTISGIEIEVLDSYSPKQADVDMIATAIVSDARGRFRDVRALRRIIVTLEQTSDDEWIIVDYNHTPINGQADAFSPKQIVTSRTNVRN